MKEHLTKAIGRSRKLRHLVAVRIKACLLSSLMVALPILSSEAAHTQATLLLGAESARPGSTVLAGVKLQMEPEWHTYWRNPGIGTPTQVKWQLPAGVTAGEIQWPIPEKLPEQELTTYIYKDTVVLLVTLKVSQDVPPGPLPLKAEVSWLECNVQCIPGQGTVQATLNVGPEDKPSKEAPLLQTWQKRLPLASAPPEVRATWEKPATKDSRPLALEWRSDPVVTNADFFPNASENFDVLGQTEKLPSDPDTVRIRKLVKKIEGDWPRQVSGLLVEESTDRRAGYEATLELAATPGEKSPIGAAAQFRGSEIWKMLLYAFIGGLILNVMPCVLPVLALKVLGFVSQGREDPRRARKLGLIYALGVLVSFLALAALVIAVKSAGHKAGWGLQFGNPYFLVAMTTLVTLIALNLFGVFEVHLGGSAMNTASKLSSRHGAAGAFFNGLLATVLATSCTAPFLGAAIGFAFAQPPAIVLLVLGMVGVGLAAPYVVLTWQPGWLKFLPKPGAWMERFKVVMGFPMLAAAVWLFSLASSHYGERALWLAIFLVLVALAAWIYGEFLQRNRSHPRVALTVLLLILVGGYAFALEKHLQWRAPQAQASAVGSQASPSGIEWQRWTRAAVEQARAEGRPVLVDFTAKWCLTCNTIVKPALESASVQKKIKEVNAATFLGDYTGFADEITDELNRYGRAGVPLVLVFPKSPEAPAIVLPEALTPGMVVGALERAAKL